MAAWEHRNTEAWERWGMDAWSDESLEEWADRSMEVQERGSLGASYGGGVRGVDTACDR